MTPTLEPLNLPLVLNGNALALPLADDSVSLIVSSPPYWALRVYEDGGEFYDGQIGSEPDPVLFLRNLWHAMDEAWRVLRPDGVAWVNLGDKYAGSGGHNNSNLSRPSKASQHPSPTDRATHHAGGERPGKAATERDRFRSAKAADARDTSRGELNVPAATRASRRKIAGRSGPDTRDKARAATRRNAPDRYRQGTEWARAKSLMALPWAFVLGLLNPAMYRDHLDPVPLVECPTCEGRDPAEYIDDPPCTVCPTCEGEGVIEGEHPQWIYRAEQVWDKPNGLPESVDDRPRRSHEVFLMLTKNGDHYAAIDDLREPYDEGAHASGPNGARFVPGPPMPTWGLMGSNSLEAGTYGRADAHPLGKLPGSVWRIPSEPFAAVLYHVDTDGGRVMPADLLWHDVRRALLEGDDRPVLVREAEHFAPFPSEWPRRLVLGWSPQAICSACGEGRFPVAEVEHHEYRGPHDPRRPGRSLPHDDGARGNGYSGQGKVQTSTTATILGYACACTPRTEHGPAGASWNDAAEVGRVGKRAKPDGTQNLHKARAPRRTYHLTGWDPPPSSPSVVLDVFGGTGTTAMVAAALGRTGISVDLSFDYCQLAKWRGTDPKNRAKARSRTLAARQGTLGV